MQMLTRHFRSIAVAALATIIIAVSAFVPAKEAALSPRFNHVMLFVSNLDSSITFYTAAFDLKVAQRITELSVTDSSGAPRARPVKMALLRFPGQEFVLELAERPASTGPAPYYVTALLVLVAMAASWLPARRASAVDPLAAPLGDL